MTFQIQNGINAGQMRIIGDQGHLIGLITPCGPERAPEAHRVELMMKLDTICSSKKEAVSFVRGAEAAMRAYKIIPTKDAA